MKVVNRVFRSELRSWNAVFPHTAQVNVRPAAVTPMLPSGLVVSTRPLSACVSTVAAAGEPSFPRWQFQHTLKSSSTSSPQEGHFHIIDLRAGRRAGV